MNVVWQVDVNVGISEAEKAMMKPGVHADVFECVDLRSFCLRTFIRGSVWPSMCEGRALKFLYRTTVFAQNRHVYVRPSWINKP